VTVSRRQSPLWYLCRTGLLAILSVRVSTFESCPAYARVVTLPASIPVRYTEEEAGYVTVRPVVRQTFRLDELLDMILSVTGKDAARVRQILHSGTVVYHFYRYTWAGFDADEVELSAALMRFPDADPSRPFLANQCTLAIFESADVLPKHLLELDRAAGVKRRMFRRQSFWARLLEIACNEKPAYQSYSYAHRADLYQLNLNQEIFLQISQAAQHLAPGSLRSALKVLQTTGRVLLICPRLASARKPEIPGELRGLES
jgi:hypothetical protein